MFYLKIQTPFHPNIIIFLPRSLIIYPLLIAKIFLFGFMDFNELVDFVDLNLNCDSSARMLARESLIVGKTPLSDEAEPPNEDTEDEDLVLPVIGDTLDDVAS